MKQMLEIKQMPEGLRRLYSGEFNHVGQEIHNDNTITITLSKEEDTCAYRFKVKDLYGENEEVLEHEVIETKPPKHIQDRMKAAVKEAKDVKRKTTMGS